MQGSKNVECKVYKCTGLKVKHDISGLHAQHLVDSSLLGNGDALTRQELLGPVESLLARHVGPSRGFVQVGLLVRLGAQTVVLGAKADEFPPAVGPALPLDFGESRCFDGRFGSGGLGDEKERFLDPEAFCESRDDGFFETVGPLPQRQNEVIHVAITDPETSGAQVLAQKVQDLDKPELSVFHDGDKKRKGAPGWLTTPAGQFGPGRDGR